MNCLKHEYTHTCIYVRMCTRIYTYRYVRIHPYAWISVCMWEAYNAVLAQVLGDPQHQGKQRPLSKPPLELMTPSPPLHCKYASQMVAS